MLRCRLPLAPVRRLAQASCARPCAPTHLLTARFHALTHRCTAHPTTQQAPSRCMATAAAPAEPAQTAARDPPAAYNPASVESKWQEVWAAQQATRASSTDSAGDTLLNSSKPPFYALSMFPYPSGALHMGHVRVYTISDALSRFMRMRGFEVLHPMGWDAFGLPAENAAIERGISPAAWTRSNIADMKAQMLAMGFGFDWNTEVATCDPSYYKWTQWIFTQLYAKGLAYQSDKEFVNWDPIDQTVLANEQVDAEGRSWRSGAIVEKRKLRQWFVRVTEYADELLGDLDKLEGWPHQVKTMQRNWIGKSDGARVVFSVHAGKGSTKVVAELPVFTTRLDTLFGITFLAVHVSPHDRHSLLAEADAAGLIPPERAQAIARYQEELARLSDVERTTEKSGVFTGLYAAHPLDATRRVPIFAASYVLADYATGAVMGVPAHDTRDAAFAKVHGLEVRRVIGEVGTSADAAAAGAEPSKTLTTGTDGMVLVNSGPFDGLTPAAATAQMVTALSTQRSPLSSSPVGAAQSLYRLKDWLVSRQRYWGAPIPIIHCAKCGAQPVPLADLPVHLPELPKLSARGGSPLASETCPVATAWRKCTCPKCSGPAQRETDTLDTFVDSSWYFLRYFDRDLADKAFDPAVANKAMPVPVYVGGIEHAILHLLYARFLTRFFSHLGLLASPEPFRNLLTQGMVHGLTYKHPRTGQFVRGHDVAFDGDKSDAKACPYVTETDASGVATKVPLQVVWEKMSKSKYNGVEPTSIARVWGADCVRLFMLFKAPPSQVLDWEEQQIKGQQRFIQRVWNHSKQHSAAVHALPSAATALQTPLTTAAFSTLSPAGQTLYVQTNEAIAGVTQQLEDRIFNVGVALLMKLINQIDEYVVASAADPNALTTPVYHHAISSMLLMLAPMTPHLSAECWSQVVQARFANQTVPVALGDVHVQSWPVASTAEVTSSTVTAVVMLGKQRIGQVDVDYALKDQPEKLREAVVASTLGVATFTGKTIKRVVCIPQKNNPRIVILNFVVA